MPTGDRYGEMACSLVNRAGGLDLVHTCAGNGTDARSSWLRGRFDQAGQAGVSASAALRLRVRRGRQVPGLWYAANAHRLRIPDPRGAQRASDFRGTEVADGRSV